MLILANFYKFSNIKNFKEETIHIITRHKMKFSNYIKLREVSEEDLEKINPNRDLYFNNIFGKKLRIVMPLEQDQKINNLISKLEELGYEVDYEDLVNKKTAYKRIKTQQGEKLRPEKVGKILQTSNSRELLDWWQKNSENLKNNEMGSSIIISRSPIDILRMSDHDGISSCHSPDGSFYKCARQEARTGGAIAYVVKNSDLRGVNIQEKEIFKDSDRDVDGIVPLERLRLRRLTDGSLDLLLPELRTYGIKNVGFLDTIKKWAKTNQENALSNIDPVDGYKSFKLKGGSYQDSDTGRVWSNFFDVNVTGTKRSQDEDEEDEDESGDLYERAESTLEDHRRSWSHIDVSLDQSEQYLIYSGYGSFSIPKKLFTVELGKYNSVNYKIVKRIVEDALDISGIEDLEITSDNLNYEFRFSFREDDRSYDELTNFEHFLDYADEVDGNFEENINKVYKALLEEGYIKDLSEKIEFKNFDIELDDENFIIKTKKPEKIGYLQDFEISRNQIRGVGSSEVRLGGGTQKKWEQDFTNYINDYKVLPIKLNTSDLDLFLSNITKGLSVPAGEKDLAYGDVKTQLSGWFYMRLNLSVGFNLYNNSDYIARLKSLDKNWNFFILKLSKLFDIFVKNKSIKSKEVYDNPKLLLGAPINKKELAKKPTVPKQQKQLGLNFKEWVLL